MQNTSSGSLMPGMTSTTTVGRSPDNPDLGATVHKLKLQWMIARDDNERRKISEEIRRLLGSPVR
jgi:hypothetical protein